jgi:hypothetical protein
MGRSRPLCGYGSRYCFSSHCRFAVASLVARLVVRALRPVVLWTRSDLDDRVVQSIASPIRLLLAFAGFHAGLLALPTSVLFRTYLGPILSAATFLALAWVAIRMIDVVALKAVATMSARRRVSASSMVPLTRRSAKVAALAIAVVGH